MQEPILYMMGNEFVTLVSRQPYNGARYRTCILQNQPMRAKYE